MSNVEFVMSMFDVNETLAKRMIANGLNVDFLRNNVDDVLETEFGLASFAKKIDDTLTDASAKLKDSVDQV